MQMKAFIRALGLAIACAAALAGPAQSATSVTLFGDLQSELGCPGDYQPACATTHLTYDATDGTWQGAFSLPMGTWSYQAAIDDSFAELYGDHATRGGVARSFTLGSSATVKFLYDPVSHWITSNRNSAIATAAGDFQSELGCPGDWQPDCLRSWLQDIDGDGISTYATSTLPPGSYQWKVAIDQGWTENYGAGGALGGAQLPFTVATGDQVTFAWNSSTHVPAVTVTPPTPAATPTPTPSPSTTPTPSPAPPAPSPTPNWIGPAEPGSDLLPAATAGLGARSLTKSVPGLLKRGLRVAFTSTDAGAITWRLSDAKRGTNYARGQLTVRAGTSTKALRLTKTAKRRIASNGARRFRLDLSWVDSRGDAVRLTLNVALKAK